MSERREAAFTAADAQWLHNRLADEGRDPSTVVAVMIEWGLLRLVPRLEALEGEPTPTDTPTDTPTPEPGEPKVVGYVRADYLNNFPEYADSISPRRTVNHMHPVILQSDHEAVVRGLREHRSDLYQEHLHVIADLGRTVGDASNLKAENERLEKEVNDTVIKASKQLQERNDEITRLKAENEELRERNEQLTQRLDRFADHLQVRDRQVATLRRERDAYADPGNWVAKAYPSAADAVMDRLPWVTEKDARAIAPKLVEVVVDNLAPITYIGPTPSDTEAESVEGEVAKAGRASVRVELGYWTPDWLIHGQAVRITRIPTPGGDDGEE